MASPRGLELLLVAALFVGCGGADGQAGPHAADPGSHDRVRVPAGVGADDCTPGEHTLRLGGGRSARLRVTPGPRTRPRGLILAFHGAGGSAAEGLFVFRGAWSVPGLVLVAPKSLGSTWSALQQPQDRDLETVNRALRQVWRRCRIDRSRVAVGGFSDGATHALSIGLQNGDIFRSVMALSPGGLLDVEHRGRPRVFVSHGAGDDVLPVGRSDEAVRTLRSSGYSVRYRRFPGGHEVSESISREAVRWYLRR